MCNFDCGDPQGQCAAPISPSHSPWVDHVSAATKRDALSSTISTHKHLTHGSVRGMWAKSKVLGQTHHTTSGKTKLGNICGPLYTENDVESWIPNG